MTRTKYMHYVISEYLSVSMACVFVLENYRQQTAEDANQILRDQFNKMMDEYKKAYHGRGNWPSSTEDLVDYKMITYLRSVAEKAADTFVGEFEKLVSTFWGKTVKVQSIWEDLKRTQHLSSAVIDLAKEIRKMEEADLLNSGIL